MVPTYTCDDVGVDGRSFESKTPLPDASHAVQQLHALLPTRPDVGKYDYTTLQIVVSRTFRRGGPFLPLPTNLHTHTPKRKTRQIYIRIQDHTRVVHILYTTTR